MRSLLALVLVLSMFSVGCGGASSVLGTAQVSQATAQILYPPAMSTTDANAVIVRGNASDPNGVAGVTVNGVPATSSDGFRTWQVTLPLQLGQQQIVVDVQDTLGLFAQGAAAASINREVVFAGRFEELVVDAANNRVLALEASRGMVCAIDRTTRALTIISGPGVPDNVEPLISPVSMALDAARNRVLVATSRSSQQIVAVDLTTGARTRIGAYPDVWFRTAGAIRVDATRDRLMLLQYGNIRADSVSRIIAQDLTTGQGTFFSQAGIPDNVNNPETAFAMGFDPVTGRMWIPAGRFGVTMLEVNPNTGARTVLTGGLGFSGHFDYDASGNRLVRTANNRLDAINETTGEVTTISAPGLPDDLVPFDRANDAVVDADANRALVTDRGGRRIVAVDLTTGARSVFFDSRTGSGPAISNPNDVILDAANNRLLVAGRQAIIAVDLATGSRSTVSSNTVPNADNPFVRLSGLALEPSGNSVLATDASGRALLRVDLATGARTVLSAAGVPDNLNTFSDPQSVFYDVIGNRALVVDASEAAVYAVDVSTGARTALSDAVTPDNVNPMSEPLGGALDVANSRLLVGDYGNESLIAVDLATGQRSVISTPSSGGTGGGVYYNYGTMSVDPLTGAYYFSDDSYLSVQSIDPTTGDRTLISGPTDLATTDHMSGMAAAAFDGTATIFVADTQSGAVAAIDAMTGERVFVTK